VLDDREYAELRRKIKPPILGRAPKGRDEGGQPMSWLRRHDEDESE